MAIRPLIVRTIQALNALKVGPVLRVNALISSINDSLPATAPGQMMTGHLLL